MRTLLALALAGILGASLMAQAAEDTQQHDHKAALKNPDGTWKWTNALINESSPYLLQHAHNPVDWRPWGKEAFEEARKAGKPIFLSIGYSTCYWCHVMERQCFENPDIAKQMNEQFICIKVDREERPDVDDIYMTATQMMTGRGGWPMSVFLTPPGSAGKDDPGLKPFFAGTYFPPEPMRGMPAFTQVMDHLTEAWNQRRGEVIEVSGRAAEAIRQHMSQREVDGELTLGAVQRATMQLLRMYDAEHGGYGQAPKFPTPNNLYLLMAVHRSSPDDELWQSLAYTLERMARGGMYDQIGGGFHRYSVDAKWLVPHFEKMLYDNGQLVQAYLMAQAIKPDADDAQLYARVVRETCDYVLREMTDETGAFWSAQDAEVNAREGGNYVWTPQEVRKAIEDEELADLAIEMYGLDQGVNFQDPHHPDEPPTNVIYLPVRLDELAKERGMSVEEMAKKRKQINDILYPVRMKRPQPGTDDKVIVSWNGIMIAGMARAGRQLEEPRYTQAAAKAADYIVTKMRTDDGGLHRTARDGQIKINAFLEDYAFLVRGLIELHRTTKESRWLDAAKELTAYAVAHFADERGGYYDTLADQPDLFVRTRTTYDGAISSGNAQMIHNLLDLHELTGEASHLDRAAKDLQSFASALRERGAAMAHMQWALLRAAEMRPAIVEGAQPAAAAAAAPVGDDAKKEPVAVNVEPGKVDVSAAGDKGVAVKVTLKIGGEYHINGNKPGEEFLIPTALRIEQAKGYTVDVKWPAAKQKKYDFADKPLSVYEGTVVVEATITKTAEATGKPVLVLTYQACTDKTCLAPKDVEVPVVIR